MAQYKFCGLHGFHIFSATHVNTKMSVNCSIANILKFPLTTISKCTFIQVHPSFST